jgi:hypothetical protein
VSTIQVQNGSNWHRVVHDSDCSVGRADPGDFAGSSAVSRLFLIAVVVADMWAGGIAGISASLLSVLLTWFFFMPPQWSFAFPTMGDGLTIALLLIVSLLLGHLWHNQRETIFVSVRHAKVIVGSTSVKRRAVQTRLGFFHTLCIIATRTHSEGAFPSAPNLMGGSPRSSPAGERGCPWIATPLSPRPPNRA